MMLGKNDIEINMKQETLSIIECETALEKDIPINKNSDEDEDSYACLMRLNKLVSDVASVKNMEKGLERLNDRFAADKDFQKDINITLGMANTLMLRLDTAKEYFIKAGAVEKLEETFILAQKYGRYKLVKEFLEYGKHTGDSRFNIGKDNYLEFLSTKAIQHLPLYREGTDFTIDKNDLEEILDEYEAVYDSKTDKKSIVKNLLSNLESEGNLNTPKKLFLADYCQDVISAYNNLEDYDAKKKGIRKNIDSLVNDYCKNNNLKIIKKIQDGDNDDFFPISSNLYLALNIENGQKIVLKENLKLYVDFSRADGYNMEKEIYEKIKQDWIKNDQIRNNYIKDNICEAAKNIVRYLGAENIGGIELLKLEFFEGKKLSEYTNKSIANTLPMNETVSIVRKIADIINYLHSKDIIYSDIKDTNILYNRETHDVRLLDFGMARLFEEKVTGSTEGQSLLSTPKYVPPEMGTQFQFSKKSDVFQLGVLFYEMITGHHPFSKSDFMEGEGYRESEIMKYSLANITQEPELKYKELYQHSDVLSLILQSLEKDPSKRISMNEFYSDITKIEEDMLR